MSPRTLAMAGLLPAAALLAGTTPAPTAGDVTVTITNLRSHEGQVFACLAKAKTAFPDCSGPGGRELVMPTPDATHFTFHDVTPGLYAIALLHDENSNGKIDKALMIPKEGFGFSRDAKLRMGPPNFSDAAFEVGTQGSAQSIRMRYLM